MTSTPDLTLVGPKQIYVLKGGNGEDAIVFIHGLGGNHIHFDAILQTLNKEHRTVSYDLDGHGLTPIKPTTSISVEFYANDLYHLLEDLSIGKIKLVAHSMGCLVALVFAIQWPQKVEKIVLLGPPPYPIPEPGRESLRKRAEMVKQAGMTSIVEAVVTASTSLHTKNTNPLALSLVRMSILTTQPEGYAKACLAFASDIEGLVPSKIHAPTLIITGTEDQVCPPIVAQKLSSTIPGATAHILEEIGHQHVWEATEQVGKLVKGFLESQ